MKVGRVIKTPDKFDSDDNKYVSTKSVPRDESTVSMDNSTTEFTDASVIT